MHQHFTCLPGAHFSCLAASYFKTPRSLGPTINCRNRSAKLSSAVASSSPDLIRIYIYTPRAQSSGLVSTTFAPPQRLAHDSCAEIPPVRSFCPYPAVWISH